VPLARPAGGGSGFDPPPAHPGSLEVSINQDGTNLSGGQCQWLPIARALVAQPWLHPFDDWFFARRSGTATTLSSWHRKRFIDRCGPLLRGVLARSLSSQRAQRHQTGLAVAR